MALRAWENIRGAKKEDRSHVVGTARRGLLSVATYANVTHPRFGVRSTCDCQKMDKVPNVLQSSDSYGEGGRVDMTSASSDKRAQHPSLQRTAFGGRRTPTPRHVRDDTIDGAAVCDMRRTVRTCGTSG